MTDPARDFLTRLLETPSPSGFEAAGQRVWANHVRPHADTFESDSYGNAWATLNPAGTPRILLAGHADELGFMVGYINDDGFLYFKGIGGVDPALIRGQRVIVHGRNGSVPGVTGQLAIHLQKPDDRKKVPDIEELTIDIGARSRAEAEAVVAVGDAITYSAGVLPLLGDRIAARGCDNRIGTWAAAEALRRIAARRDELQACVIATSTIQEENGLYGATMAAYTVRPDVALVVDVTHATDTPQASKTKHGDVRLGKGPVISIGSANHPVVNRRLRTVAEKAGIALQAEINPRWTGSDADAVFVTRGGIPTASIGLPNRYMHSPVEVIELSDLDALANLLAAFVLDVQADEKFRVEI
ncbi:MAG TPA: M42 family metallopeptidase [Chthoniobacterales bacterium]